MSGTDYTTTPNLGLKKPIYDADPEQWGNHLNENSDILDTALGPDGTTWLPIAGGTMTGPVALAGVNTAPNPAAGNNSQQLATTAFVAAANGNYLPLAGGVLTGNLTISNVAIIDGGANGPAQLFLDAAAGVLRLIAGRTGSLTRWTVMPGNTVAESGGNAGSDFVVSRFNDAGGYIDNPLTINRATGAVSLATDATAATDALNLRTADGRYGAQSASNNTGRNLLHNPLFRVQQRGAGPWTTTGAYTVDRWLMGFVGGSLTTAPGLITDGSRGQIGDEAAVYAMSVNCTGGSGVNDEAYFEQRIEGVRRTAGKTVTLSFWAVAASGTPKVGVMPYQVFGTGGSPSATVAIPGQAVTLSSTSYTRYVLTFSMPSVAGKTFGSTAGTDYQGIRFAVSAGANTSSQYGGIGVQTANVLLWGIQLEIGSVATPLEKPDPQQDLAKCQRFYQTSYAQYYGYAYIGALASITNTLLVPMRATPTIVPTMANVVGVSGATIAAYGSGLVTITGTGTATGPFTMQGNFTASADL